LTAGGGCPGFGRFFLHNTGFMTTGFMTAGFMTAGFMTAGFMPCGSVASTISLDAWPRLAGDASDALGETGNENRGSTLSPAVRASPDFELSWNSGRGSTTMKAMYFGGQRRRAKDRLIHDVA
jgi:hypothetical protein